VPAVGSVRPVVDGVSRPTYDGRQLNVPSLPVPSMRCMRDDDDVWSRSWSRSSRWAQRLPVSRARVTFDLVFDRNSWPAAMEMGFILPPGVKYPVPTSEQLKWLQLVLLDDLKDQLGVS